MQSDEVKAAAERLRKHNEALLLSKRVDSPYWVELNSPELGLAHDWDIDQLRKDDATLASAYLAEHPADEDQPIDETWLLSIGFKPWPEPDEFEEFQLYLPMQDEITWECRLAYQSNDFYSVRMCDPEEYHGASESVALFGTRNTTATITRGQLRLLCRALGIQLQEDKPKEREDEP